MYIYNEICIIMYRDKKKKRNMFFVFKQIEFVFLMVFYFNKVIYCVIFKISIMKMCIYLKKCLSVY